MFHVVLAHSINFTTPNIVPLPPVTTPNVLLDLEGDGDDDDLTTATLPPIPIPVPVPELPPAPLDPPVN